jgi:hypothetical protein
LECIKMKEEQALQRHGSLVWGGSEPRAAPYICKLNQ